MKKETSTETTLTFKTGNCPSRSGKSKLTYLIGADADSEIHLWPIFSTRSPKTGKKLFSKEHPSSNLIQIYPELTPSVWP